jgi:hypothetical protein
MGGITGAFISVGNGQPLILSNDSLITSGVGGITGASGGNLDFIKAIHSSIWEGDQLSIDPGFWR